MRVKNVTIGIKSVEEMLNETKDDMKCLERGEKVKRKSPAYTLRISRE